MQIKPQEVAAFLVGFLVIIIPLLVLWNLGIFNMGCKPAIYLYPEEPMIVDVKVHPQGILTNTIPNYNSGWKVHVNPSGLIDGRYSYLFYETLTVNSFDSNRGWVVKADELSKWFDENLPTLGLNQAEAAAMREYWVSALDKDGYYKITLLDDGALDRFSTLEINPKPDTEIRVILNFKHIREPVEVEEPDIITPVRKGFTVVEWGGVKTL